MAVMVTISRDGVSNASVGSAMTVTVMSSAEAVVAAVGSRGVADGPAVVVGGRGTTVEKEEGEGPPPEPGPEGVGAEGVGEGDEGVSWAATLMTSVAMKATRAIMVVVAPSMVWCKMRCGEMDRAERGLRLLCDKR